MFRVRATGVKRKTGPAKGSSRAPKTGVRKRTFPGLPELYASEGLPAATGPEGLKPAERRTLEQMRVLQFVEAVQQTSTTEKPRWPACARKAPRATSQGEHRQADARSMDQEGNP
jgi:hypothetical protein